MNKFDKAVVSVPNKSGFDLSHPWTGTLRVGTLTPVFTKEMIPNDTIDVRVSAKVEFPPMATDFYGRVQCKLESFFVPYRILYGGWKKLVENALPTAGSSPQQGYPWSRFIPGLKFSVPSDSSVANVAANKLKDAFRSGSLADYLQFQLNTTEVTGTTFLGRTFRINNPFRFLAYHRIYQDHYIDHRTMHDLFAPLQYGNSGVYVDSYSSIPYMQGYGFGNNSGSKTWLEVWLDEDGDIDHFNDGSSIFDLHQRLWDKDYFVNATSKPQFGGEQSVAIVNDSFTISSLRVANSLQMFSEKFNIAGDRYPEIHKILYGIYPADAITDRAIYLGRYCFDVYNKGVFQQNGSLDSGDGSGEYPNPIITNNRNPFGSTGAKYGSSMGLGDGKISKFTASEHGIYMILMSIVPDALYSTGVHRAFMYDQFIDIPSAQLANVGDQPILRGELVSTPVVDTEDISVNTSTFAYTQRFAEHKTMLGEVHGLLRSGESLQAFTLDRAFFTGTASFGKDFQTIKPTSMDNVASIEDSISDFGAWASLWFDSKLISTLPAYSIPSLVDMENYNHKEVVDNGSKRF